MMNVIADTVTPVSTRGGTRAPILSSAAGRGGGGHVTRAGPAISLDIRNDGVRRPLRCGDGSGLVGLKDRAADAGGWATGRLSGDDEFHLCVELPGTNALAERP